MLRAYYYSIKEVMLLKASICSLKNGSFSVILSKQKTAHTQYLSAFINPTELEIVEVDKTEQKYPKVQY